MDLSLWTGRGPIDMRRRKADETVALNDPSAPFGAYGLNNTVTDPATGLPAMFSIWDKPSLTGVNGGTGETDEERQAANNKYDSSTANPSSSRYGITTGNGLSSVNPGAAAAPAGASNSFTRGNYMPSFGSAPNGMSLPPPAPTPYTVKSGDTLGAIAQNMGGGYSKFPEIAKANGITNPNRIYPGQQINLGQAPAPVNPTQAVGGAAINTPPQTNVPLEPSDRVQRIVQSAYAATAANNGAKMVNGTYVGNGGPQVNDSGRDRYMERTAGYKPADTFEQRLQLAGAKTSSALQVEQAKQRFKLEHPEAFTGKMQGEYQEFMKNEMSKGASFDDAETKWAQVANDRMLQRGMGYAQGRAENSLTDIYDPQGNVIGKMVVADAVKKVREDGLGSITSPSEGLKQKNKSIQIKDMESGVSGVRNAITGLRNQLSETQRLAIFKANQSADSVTAIQNLITGEFGKSLTPDQKAYLVAANSLQERIMGLRSLLQSGQGSDQQRAKLLSTIPSGNLFDPQMANMQLDTLENMLGILKEGIPTNIQNPSNPSSAKPTADEIRAELARRRGGK